ncbi:MAG: hypothetical protein P4L50_11855 [Anaerolineaceae bacterium]|nr:hypothetical protein [Anaerolineaceae bacterium]
MLKITWDLTPAEVSVLCTLLLTPGTAISQLILHTELPFGTAARLGSAINCAGTIHTISLGYRYESYNSPVPELLRTLNLVASPVLEQLDPHIIIKSDKRILCDSLEEFTSIRSLTISGYCDCGHPIPWLMSRIGRLRALESLRITNVYIRGSDAEALAATLKDLATVVELGICSCGLGEKAGRPIGSLVALGRVKKLVLERSCFKDEEVSAMVNEILSPSGVHSCELQQLSLETNNIGPTGGTKLVELVAHSPHLRVLKLRIGSVGEIAAAALFKAIRLRSHSLEELDVTGCELDPRGALLDELRAFPALKVLRIGQSSEGDLGTHALVQLLLSYGGCRLVELQIQCINITETGALVLAGALAKAYALRIICMNGSPFGPRGAAAIFDALSEASTMPMDAIDFSNCGVGDDGASAAGRLILCRGCRHVYFCGNKVSSTGAKAIMDSAAISPGCMINFLDLSDNPIGDEGVGYIMDKLVRSRRRLVHKLGIENTKMGVRAAMAIKLAVETYGFPYWICVTRHNGDMEADNILEGVEKWERDSKPSRTAILQLSG